MIARGSAPTPAQLGMNKTEAAYAYELEIRKRAGEIAWFRFEGVTLKLAHDTRYTPDFAVMLANGEMEMHETKGGFMREDSFIKIKLAASLFPFRFYLIRRDKSGWTIKEIAT